MNNISVVNFTAMHDTEVLTVLRAVNRQIREDFAPYWDIYGELRLEGTATKRPGREAATELRGDAIIYLCDVLAADTLGHHESNSRGVPIAFVYTEVSQAMGESWSATLSHEALEMLADPHVNILAEGPHPSPNTDRRVYHWYEVCDAVQDQTYLIDNVEVSNFVLPSYFTPGEQKGQRTNFMGSKLRSFGCATGGYVGFFDPKTGQHENYAPYRKGEVRLETKKRLGEKRRSAARGRR